jgi:hypothetical protein
MALDSSSWHVHENWPETAQAFASPRLSFHMRYEPESYDTVSPFNLFWGGLSIMTIHHFIHQSIWLCLIVYVNIKIERALRPYHTYTLSDVSQYFAHSGDTEDLLL